MSAQFQLNQIGQIAINVHDVDRATAFYRDTLGMRYLFTAGELAFFDCGGIRLMLAKPEKPELDHPASILYYKVSDIQKAYEALSTRKVKVEEAPILVARLEKADLWLSSFRDSEGNLLALMSEV
ncbi:MAG: VOC family protein, partial [Terriglobales bacterium]